MAPCSPVGQANPRVYTKTSLMLGLGETQEEVVQVRPSCPPTLNNNRV
jgi:lipoate synthase